MASDPELYRRINDNLRKIYDGTYKREAALERARERPAKEFRRQERRWLLDDRKELRQQIAALRHEIDELQRGYQWLYDKNDAGTLSTNCDGLNEYGALEEIDHRITDVLTPQLVDAIERLEHVEDMLR